MTLRVIRASTLVVVILTAVSRGDLAAAGLPEPLPEPAFSVLRGPAGNDQAPADPAEGCVATFTGPHAYAGMVQDRAVAALGAASCATVSCHGGPLAGNRDVQSFAATIWAGDDPHARGYEVLHGARSQRMARQLGIGPPHRAQQCLVCHSVQDMARERLPQEVLADGVGCAACHGDATHWQQAHTLASWKDLPREARAALGYRDLSTPLSRVETCIRCHVGDAGHEVNHDMIAAGHPRLFFEFAAYQRLEPRHWSPRGKVESAADFTARSWSVGQAATLAAVADLLVTRVQRARDAGESGHPQRWPEFSEFDCYACHRTLGPDKSAANREPALQQPRVGQPSWQPWQVAGARLLRAGLEGPAPIDGTSVAALERSVVDIRLLLDTQWAAADRERLNRVLLEASGLAVAARRSGAEINAWPLITVDASHHTLDAITAANPTEWQTWDAAVQTSLALEAGRQGGPATIGIWRTSGQRQDAALSIPNPRRSLDELRARLRFPPERDSPGSFDPRSFQQARRLVP